MTRAPSWRSDTRRRHERAERSPGSEPCRAFRRLEGVSSWATRRAATSRPASASGPRPPRPPVADRKRDGRDEVESPEDRKGERGGEDRAERIPAHVGDRGARRQGAPEGARLPAASRADARAGDPRERRTPIRRRVQHAREQLRDASDGRFEENHGSGAAKASSKREDNDVLARRPTHHEELGIPLQHREDGLADAEAPERRKVGEAPPVGGELNRRARGTIARPPQPTRASDRVARALQGSPPRPWRSSRC